MGRADRSIPEVLQRELFPGERIEWLGQPDPRRWFATADVFLVPFSLLWGGFAIFWEVSVITDSEEGGPFFVLWGIPFVLMGLYFMVGRFFYKAWRKRRTIYAVSDRRVFVVRTAPRPSVSADFIDRVPTINHTIRTDGSGTVRFGNPSWFGSAYANTGMEFFNGFHGGADAMSFYDLPDAREVVSLLEKLRRR